GLIPATVTTGVRASLWSAVLDNIRPQPGLTIASGEQVGWVMRKNNPQFKALVDEFVQSHAVGTAFGNTLLQRYLRNTQWVTQATSHSDMDKFESLLTHFRRFGDEYDFDHLLLAAQGYQESRLNQSMTGPGGSVGVMQVRPHIVAASPINIPDVYQAGP